MDSKRTDIGVGIILCILSAVVYLYAEQYSGRGVNQYGPNFFPQTLSALLFVAAAALIFQALRGNALKSLEGINKQGLVRAAVTLLIAIAYLLLTNVLGFYVSTIIFLFVVMLYLGQKKHWLNALVSFLVASSVYSLLHLFLKIPLPQSMFIG